MKNIFSAIALTVALMSAASASFAQEVAMRSGVIVGIKTTQNAAEAAPREQSETGRRLGSALGRFVGATVQRHSGHYYGYEAVNAGEAIGGAVGSSGSQSAAGSSAYLIMVKFDDGGTTAVKQDASNGLRVGSRVYVMGEGSQAEVVAE